VTTLRGEASAERSPGSNPAVVWEATGVGFSTGDGIYRSADTGSTWATPCLNAPHGGYKATTGAR
jgi:hypothetical protein